MFKLSSVFTALHANFAKRLQPGDLLLPSTTGEVFITSKRMPKETSGADREDGRA